MEVVCPHCNATLEIEPEHAGEKAFCPECGGKFQAPIPQAQPVGAATTYTDEQAYRDFVSKKVAVGVVAIVFGSLGVHKFIMGLTTGGTIMLLTSLCFGFTICCVGLPFGFAPMWLIGIVEGIIYLSKSDEEFYRDYAIEEKQWF